LERRPQISSEAFLKNILEEIFGTSLADARRSLLKNILEEIFAPFTDAR